MPLITRRHFARQMAFAAALCGHPLWAMGESQRLFDADKQNGAPPDPQTIRRLASQIVGQVITPEAADYDAARSIFNRAFDRRPAVIVRCGSPSDVARSLDFAQAQHLGGRQLTKQVAPVVMLRPPEGNGTTWSSTWEPIRCVLRQSVRCRPGY
jgi:hypothetical protein